MKSLNIDFKSFPFYEREKKNGKFVKNKCGRDFLYYALVFYDIEDLKNINPKVLDYRKTFGIPVPSWLAWTQIQFYKAPSFFLKNSLLLKINNRKILSFFDFFIAIIFSQLSFNNLENIIINSIENNKVVGIDISIGFFGLLDHVLFVYGYDNDNYFVIETTETPIKYEKIDQQYPMLRKLPKSEVKNRWTRFGRVWEVGKIPSA